MEMTAMSPWSKFFLHVAVGTPRGGLLARTRHQSEGDTLRGLTMSRSTRSGVQLAHADIVLPRSKRQRCPSACHHNPRGHSQRTVACARAARINLHPFLYTSKIVCSMNSGAQDYSVDEWSLRQIPKPHETN